LIQKLGVKPSVNMFEDTPINPWVPYVIPVYEALGTVEYCQGDVKFVDNATWGVDGFREGAAKYPFPYVMQFEEKGI
jgi:hypothetical protein